MEKLRPHLEVVVVEPEDLVSEAERLHPEMLFSHLRGSEMPTHHVGAWVALSVEPDLPSVTSVDGSPREIENLDLDGLLAIVDEAERHLEEGHRPSFG